MADDDDAFVVLACCLVLCTICSMCSSSSSSIAMMSAKGGTSKSAWKNSPHMKQGTPPGLWESNQYGGKGGKTYRAMCPANSYVSDVIGFYGQGTHTNALQAWCYNPDTHAASRLFDGQTCGKRDYPSAGAAFEFVGYMLAAITVAIGTFGAGLAAIVPVFMWMGPTLVPKSIGWADARKNLLKPQFGRKLYKYLYMSAGAGIYKWSVNPKNNEIHGLNLYGLTGEESGWIGGRSSGSRVGPGGPRKSLQPVLKDAVTGQCPLGKVVVGIEANCGDRIDGLKFLCDVPRHKN
jgi:hypothetical protein